MMNAEQLIVDKQLYSLVYKDNGDILLTKKQVEKQVVKQDAKIIKSVLEIKNYDLKKSQIISCSINNIPCVKLKYGQVRDEIYKIIGDGATIIKKSNLHIKTFKKVTEGFVWMPELGISVQRAESNKTIIEIMEQTKCHGIVLRMQIRLIDGTELCVYI